MIYIYLIAQYQNYQTRKAQIIAFAKNIIHKHRHKILQEVHLVEDFYRGNGHPVRAAVVAEVEVVVKVLNCIIVSKIVHHLLCHMAA